MDRAVWLATSQDWCFLELSIGKRCLLELRDKGFEISPGGKEGEKKKVAVSTNNLKKSATQSFQPNSEHLLFIVHASWVGFPFPADAKPSGFFQRRYKQFTSVLLCTDLSRACMQTFKAARSY